MDAIHHGGHRLFWLQAVGMTPVMLKCRGESAAGEPCTLKRACARWYIAPNKAGWLDAPKVCAGGCLDFLAFGPHHLPHSPPFQGGVARSAGVVPGEGRDGDGAER